MPENSVTLIGNITREPELKYAASGSAVVKFGLAVNRRYMRDGEWQEETSFFNVVAFGPMGENVADLPKGARVIVFGRLNQRTWEKDGEKRSTVEVTADDIGASLRWATVTINKNERTSPGKPADLPTFGSSEEPF